MCKRPTRSGASVSNQIASLTGSVRNGRTALGVISEFCAANGITLEILASYTGMFPALLQSMDQYARKVPDDMVRHVCDFIDIREQIIENMTRNIIRQRADVGSGYRTRCQVMLIYSNREDYESLKENDPNLDHVIHRYLLETLRGRLRASHGIELSLILFDRAEYEIWLEGNMDSMEARAMWAARKYFQQDPRN